LSKTHNGNVFVCITSDVGALHADGVVTYNFLTFCKDAQLWHKLQF